ncbi:MAG TPA: hypothetical protein VNS09_03075 [Solirubrobacter sp.]|nr:hypothetical protein [Solirubrobacter sp.]
MDDLEERYATFLETVQRPEEIVLAEFEDPERRKTALGEAGEFGDRIYELVKATAVDERRMRYLLI